jgi:integrase
MQNTVRGMIERLHAMLQKAVNYGYPVNNTFREIMIPEEEVGMVFLDMTEITRIYYYDKLTKFQTAVKDLFIVGCLTGLRHSDYSMLTEANFINHGTQIRVKTRKTGAVVQLPVHPFVREIFEKYGRQMPKASCIQYFNLSLKKICRKIGINTPVNYERTVGLQVVRKICEKWQMIGSHTARRSFATNTFLAGIPAYRIMLITGHRSEKSFFKYVRITREENALALSGHRFFQ